jgi:RNA polymerase sigma-70 factor (ECF subfamily)
MMRDERLTKSGCLHQVGHAALTADEELEEPKPRLVAKRAKAKCCNCPGAIRWEYHFHNISIDVDASRRAESPCNGARVQLPHTSASPSRDDEVDLWCLRRASCHYLASMVTPDRASALFHAYHQPLVRFLTRQLGDRDWAEEIAQETFMRALQQDVILSERSWIFAVAMNLVRDETRKAARQRRRLELMRDEAKAESVVLPGPTSMEREEERAAARLAVDTLADRDRNALLMREEGLSYEEIAAALELSVGSVGTTLSRARRRLMEAYEALQAERTAEPA